MKTKLIVLGVVTLVLGVLGYRSQYRPVNTTSVQTIIEYQPIGDPSKLATYENSNQMFFFSYPSNWILHSLPKPFYTATVERVSFTVSSNPADGRDPVLVVYAEYGKLDGSSQPQTEDDWVRSNQISNYAEVKNVGKVTIGEETYTHFEIRAVGEYVTSDEPHEDFYALKRNRYPAMPETGDVPISFIGFSIPSDSKYQKEAMNVIKSYQSWGVFQK